MAGPTVSVALQKPLNDMQIDQLGDWLHAIGDVERVERNPDGGYLGIANWDLRVIDLVAIGMEQPPGYGRSDTCPVLVGVDPTRDPSGMLYWDDEDDVAQWTAQVGYFPEQEIGLAAMCNRPIDHRILGHMTLYLAERYNGIIDLGGAWIPPMDVAWLRLENQPTPPWQGGPVTHHRWIDPRTQPFVYQGPGRIFELHYIAGQDRPWYSNAADIEAFRASLENPQFRLIK
jgi:hypothetical protein